MEGIGERFARTMATRDRTAMAELLADDVTLMGVTPRKFWEASTRDEAIAVFFDNWFEDGDTVETILGIEEGEPVGARERVGYRFHVRNADGPHVVEQQAYFTERDGRITYLRIVCSGFQRR